MGDINFTKILFASLVTTFVIAMLFGVYAQYLAINGAEIDEPYNSAIQNIAGQYDGFSDVASSASDQGLVKNILDFGKNAITGTVNVFVIGLDAIGTFFTLIPLVGNVIAAITEAVPGLKPLLGLFTTLFGLYMGMRYIKSAGNKQDLP
jgi:hypothetical protein